MDYFKEIPTFITSITALAAGILAVLKYFDYKTKRDKVLQIRESFNAVVKSLSSEVEVERLAGAILLRRFFDSKSEVGTAGIPYAREAIDVSAAILRGQATGNFQKLLADGLAFAPSLERADLQRTNLQFAYLGARMLGEEAAAATVTTDLRHADFYRADLSKASLKKARARGAVFYQARLHDTVLAGADLREAYFFEADLKGAKFDGAFLLGANFRGARNIPRGLSAGLNDAGLYTVADPFVPPNTTGPNLPIRVFISKPGCLSDLQKQHNTALLTRLESEGLTAVTVERAEYPDFGILAEVQRMMQDCAGAVIFGFTHLDVREGVFRPGTSEQQTVRDHAFPTPWNQIEAGMASVLGLPLLVVSQDGVAGGVFDMTFDEHQMYRTRVEDGWSTDLSLQSFSDWIADVRERSRSDVPPRAKTSG